MALEQILEVCLRDFRPQLNRSPTMDISDVIWSKAKLVFRNAMSLMSWLRWFLRKKRQSLFRIHLSHLLAVTLAIMVAIRERHEIQLMMLKREFPTRGALLILILTILTFVAAAWELLGNKLTTSPQEIRFQYGMSELLHKLQELSATERGEPLRQKWDSFVEEFLDIAANIFSTKYLFWRSRVHTGLMVKRPYQNSLRLSKWSGGAAYDEKLEIPIPLDDDYSDSGPAALAYKKKGLVYVPRKDREHPKEAWPFYQFVEPRLQATGQGLTDFQYKAEDPYYCWRKSAQAQQEDFRTVLCVPIGDLGVLNFSVKRLDPFIDRDFFMAETLAGLLTHADALIHDRLGSY